MKTTIRDWKAYWDDHAKGAGTDFDVDRGAGIARVQALEDRVIRQFVEAVDPQPSDRLLDAGCGTGVNCSRFHAAVREIVAMDFSEEMIRRAEKRIALENIKNVRLLVGSVTKLEFPDDAFDKVICASVLQYLDDDECEAAFREMIRVCRHGGRIVIHAKNRSSLYGASLRLWRFMAKILRRRTKADHYRPRRWYREHLSRAGGRVVDWDSFGIFTLVRMPNAVVRLLLKLEASLPRPGFIKGLGVNCQITVKVDKGASAAQPFASHA